jgi:hypothetical protein
MFIFLSRKAIGGFLARRAVVLADSINGVSRTVEQLIAYSEN